MCLVCAVECRDFDQVSFSFYRVMGFSSPLHNVKGYSASRPPVVIFVICLALFACATLAMAFFIQNAEIISNPEVKGVSDF